MTVTSLINKAATKTGILDALNSLETEELTKSHWDQYDYTIVFIAGHGGQINDKQYCFLPYDVDQTSEVEVKNTAVAWDDIYKPLKQLPGHVLVFLDACHSAGAKPNQSVVSNVQTTNAAYTSFMADLKNQPDSIITMASCNAGQTSQELDRFQHGAFAQALLEGLRADNNPVNVDQDNQVTLNGLYLYVAERLKEIAVPTPTQTTQVPELLGNLANDVNTLPLAKATRIRAALR